MFIGLNYIDGDFCPHRADFSILNSLAVFPKSNKQELAETYASAKRSLKKWSSMDRKPYMDRFLSEMEENKKGFLDFLRAESADLLNDACLESKFSECLEQCKGSTQKYLSNQVVVFSSNSFGYGSFLHRYQSLASGNVVICKPSKSFSMSMQHEVYCYDRAGFPPGVISLLHGCAVDDNI